MKQYWMILGYDMDILAIWGCGFKILVSLIVSQVIANNHKFLGAVFFFAVLAVPTARDRFGI